MPAPSRRRSGINSWKEIDIEHINELPYDIDGYKVYKLPFSNRVRTDDHGRRGLRPTLNLSKGFGEHLPVLVHGFVLMIVVHSLTCMAVKRRWSSL